MRIARVVLQNVKSYGDSTTISLEPGINAVCGENGAGKSTILEAVGFTLFGYRPYRLDAFLREGEKAGTITVTVEDDDACLFHVVRRLGSSSAQYVYDELEQRIAEGENDVRNWLLGFFGLEPTTDLAKLFEDTVGPPQGTLTAIFLESAAPRKQKFDRLLGIEDYREASQGLRAVSGLFRDRSVEAERRAALLEGEARRLPETQRRHQEALQKRAELAEELIRLNQRQEALAADRDRLEAARQAVQTAEAALDVAEARATEARRRHEEQIAELRRSEEAARQVEQSRAGYQQHREAVESLRALEERRRERDRLRQEAESAARNAVRWEQGVKALEERLAGYERDEARAAELDLLAPEQEAREKAVELARERVRAREEAERQLPAVEVRLKDARASAQTARDQLAKVEEARPAAAELEGLRGRERSLREEVARLEKDGWALKQASEGLDAGRGRLRQLEQELERVRGEAGALLPLNSLAAEASARQAARDAAAAELSGLEARRQEALRSRTQVGDGLCPFLHEPCRNLRPGVSLAAHFETLLQELETPLEKARAALDSAESALSEARIAETGLVRLPDLEQGVARLAQEKERLLEEIQERERVYRQVEQAPGELDRVLESLRALDPALATAQAAASVVAGEEGWRHQAEEAALAVEREERALAQLREMLDREADAGEALDVARKTLAELHDPRGEAAALRQRVSRERPEAERALERNRRESAGARSIEEQARAALQPFANLEEEIAAATALRDGAEAAHRLYLGQQAEAERLPQRQQAAGQAAAEATQAATDVDAAGQRLDQLRAAYDEPAHQRLRQEVERLAGEGGRVRGELELCRQEEERLAGELAELRKAREEMEAARGVAGEARRHMEAVEAVRRALEAAGPEIGGALVRRVSAMATTIHRELLGDAAITLRWGSDYEIRSLIRSEEREFKQLSGGEQMAAALAVRLALLQSLSNLRVAFLDEPTAHMDATRRANLAAQLQNLRSFDQLVVISHDDSFDTLFGHVVRLSKRNGATVVEG